MHLQIVSDLHLETHPSYKDYDLPVTARHLALLGDIGHVCDAGFFEWLERQLGLYEVIFFLFGNHEAYHMRLSSAKSRVKDFAARMERKSSCKNGTGRFVFMDQTRYDIPSPPAESGGGVGDVTILGCTLFSQVTREQATEVASQFVDFKDILEWDVGDHNGCHGADLRWLNGEVEKIMQESPDRRIVILTHYSPTVDPRTRNPKYAGSTVDSGFMTDLSEEVCWKSTEVKLRAFGHTHYNCDYVDETSGKRV